MTFPLSHWKNPRDTIACKFKGNDMEYATHGAFQSMFVLAHLGEKPDYFADKTILDYGCGTGRIARPLTALFKTVYAYDPVPECIAEGNKECAQLQFPNLVMTSDLSDVPEVDFAYSVSVIEHLTDVDARVMIDNLKRLVRHETVLWYSIKKNANVLESHKTREQIYEDSKAVTMIQVATFNFWKT